MNSKLKNKVDDDELYKYLCMWRHDEDWTDYNIALDSGDLDLMCHMMMETGAIDSTACYDWGVPCEQEIERLAKKFRKLSQAKQTQAYDDAFEGCVIFTCVNCNHVSFLNNGNQKIYAEELKVCWSCKSTEIKKTKWMRGVK